MRPEDREGWAMLDALRDLKPEHGGLVFIWKGPGLVEFYLLGVQTKAQATDLSVAMTNAIWQFAHEAEHGELK